MFYLEHDAVAQDYFARGMVFCNDTALDVNQQVRPQHRPPSALFTMAEGLGHLMRLRGEGSHESRGLGRLGVMAKGFGVRC